MANFQNLQYKINKILTSLERNKKIKYGELKQILIGCYKECYLCGNPALFKANKKSDRALLLRLANYFITTKLVTTYTIKERGWTNKMIDEYLSIDVFARNPHYKTAPAMKLYSLQKIINLEQQEKIKIAVEQNKKRRYISQVKHEQALLLGTFKWQNAIGDWDIAIALLTVLLDRAMKNEISYEIKKSFKNAKDTVLLHFMNKGYLCSTAFCNKDWEGFSYIYWFNVKGYKFYLQAYSKQKNKNSDNNSLDLEQYNIDFNQKLGKKCRQLLLKISGWRKNVEIINGLKHLLNSYKVEKAKPQYNYSVVNSFAPSLYPEPPTQDDLFQLRLAKEALYMKNRFDDIVKKLKNHEKLGCPMKYNCQYMGGLNQYRCSNREECLQLSNQLPQRLL